MATITESKSLHVVILCDKSKKAVLKSRNPSVRGLCPFVAHYERKSFIGCNKGFKGEEYWEQEKLSKPQKSAAHPYKPLNQMYGEMKNLNGAIGANNPNDPMSLLQTLADIEAKKEDPNSAANNNNSGA